MRNGATDMSSGIAEGPKKRSALVDLGIRLVKEKPLGCFGGVIVLILLFVGIFADVLAPYGYNELHLPDALSFSSGKYILGTDNLGRDLFSRVIYGARISVIVGLTAAGLGTLISTITGVVSGYLGGKFDIIVQRFVDAWMTFPGLVILLTVMSILGAGLWQVIFVLGLVFGIGGSRIIRGAVISVKENVYIQAAVAIGCPTMRILTHHILPNVMAPVIILFSTRMATVILAEASLSFLGFGIPPPVPSWGGMLSGSGREYMLLAPWMVIWPGLALSIAIYGINMFGDALRDLLDPRMRGGGGRYGGVKKKPRPN